MVAAPWVFASQLQMDIIGDRLKYATTVPAGSAQTTALWTNTEARPAYAWQPGQLANRLGSQTLTLTDSAGNTVRLSLDMKGVMYGGIPGGFTEENAPAGLDGNTVSGKQVGNSIIIDSGAAGQFTGKMFKSNTGNSYTPFTLIRPVFTVNPQSLLPQLSGLPSGVFRGSIPITYKYRVQYVAGDIWSYEARPFSLNVEVNYVAARLDNILVSGSGVLNTTYTTGSVEVKGETTYAVQAQGVMPHGIRMRFLQPTRTFALSKSPEDPTIPYNLTCTSASAACQVSHRRTAELVNNGKFMGDSTGVVLIRPNQASGRDFLFNLNVNFTSGFVPAGHYQDSFVVMFDVVIE